MKRTGDHPANTKDRSARSPQSHYSLNQHTCQVLSFDSLSAPRMLTAMAHLSLVLSSKIIGGTTNRLINLEPAINDNLCVPNVPVYPVSEPVKIYGRHDI
jgi:hypothetical protein